MLSGNKYTSRSSLGSAINQCLQQIPKEDYLSAFRDWVKKVTKMCFNEGGILWRFVIKTCLIIRSTEVIRTQWQNFLQDPRIPSSLSEWSIICLKNCYMETIDFSTSLWKGVFCLTFYSEWNKSALIDHILLGTICLFCFPVCLSLSLSLSLSICLSVCLSVCLSLSLSLSLLFCFLFQIFAR